MVSIFAEEDLLATGDSRTADGGNSSLPTACEGIPARPGARSRRPVGRVWQPAAVIRRIPAAERRARLAVRHRLTADRRTDDVVAIADDLAGLHSTDPVTVHLSVAARMRSPRLPAVDQALYDE